MVKRPYPREVYILWIIQEHMVTTAVRLGTNNPAQGRHRELEPVPVPLSSLVSPIDNVKRFIEIKTPWGDGGSRDSSFLLQLLTAKERQEENSQVTA